MKAYEYHPFSNIFPLLEGAAFAEFAANIEKRGLEQLIVLFEGKILDGRNRYRACLETGEKPRFKEYEGDDPIGFVMSLNLSRRHLDASQVAMVGARVMPMYEALAKERMRAGGREKVVANLPQAGKAREQAAAAVGSSPRSVQSAVSILKKGTPELIAAVDAGHIPVSVAVTLSKEPAQEQNAKVAAVTSGAAKPSEVVPDRRTVNLASVRALHDEGLGTTEISEKLDLPQSSISTYKTKLGIGNNSPGVKLWSELHHFSLTLEGGVLHIDNIIERIKNTKMDISDQEMLECVQRLRKSTASVRRLYTALEEKK